MNPSLHTARHIVAAFALTALAAAAQATTLVESTLVALDPYTAAGTPSLAGVVLADRVDPFSMSLGTAGNVTGTIQSRVVRSDTLGTLDFYWRVSVDARSAGSVGQFRIGNVLAGTFDAGYRTDGLGDVAPSGAYLFSPASNGNVNFRFADGIQAGQSSLFLFLHTDATHFAMTGLADVANLTTTHASNLIETYAPAAVPEPSTYALMAAGFAAVGWSVRRRRAANA